MSQITRINTLAENHHGFVWRLRGEETPAGAFDVFSSYLTPFDVDCLFFTLSVWETMNHLRAFVYESDHVEFLRRARQWTEPLDRPNLALWWLPKGHQPTVSESRDRLGDICKRGPTARAFTFSSTFPPPHSGSPERGVA